MDKLRWGLLSTARINKALIPAIRQSPRGELVAVASRDADKADDYAREWEIPVAFASYEEMLASDRVDVIYNPLPNHLHAEWSIRALEAGKHVLCEKPLAISVQEVDRMTEAARRTGRIASEAVMYLHSPHMTLVREYLDQGRLGEIQQVRGVFNFYLDRSNDVRWNKEYGGGSLWDIGLYPVSFSQFVFGGVPEWVYGDQRLYQTGVDASFNGLLHFPNGGMANISSSFRSPYHTHVEILGSEGCLHLDRPFNQIDSGRMIFTPRQGNPREIPFPKPNLYLGEVEDMHAAILNGTPTRLPLAESRKHIQILAALYESAGSGERVYIDAIG